MKRPIGVLLVSISTLVVCAFSAYLFRPWIIAAVLLAVSGAASIATIRGVGLARIGVTLTLAIAGVLAAVQVFLVNSGLKDSVPDWHVWYLWKEALLSISLLAAAAYLYSPKVNRYFAGLPKQPIPKSTKYRSAIAAIAMLGLFAFFYDLYPRLMGWPLTVDRAVDKVIASLSEEDRTKIAHDTDLDPLYYHFGLGMYIRNSYGLWAGNHRLCRSACGEPFCHPDDASGIIVNRVRERLRERE